MTPTRREAAASREVMLAAASMEVMLAVASTAEQRAAVLRGTRRRAAVASMLGRTRAVGGGGDREVERRNHLRLHNLAY